MNAGTYIGEQPDVMSARDVFAAAAMEGMLSFVGPDVEVGFDTIAQIAYDMAEAMMEQREKRP
jgi:hypothetical protein